jgi:hypothetical protein
MDTVVVIGSGVADTVRCAVDDHTVVRMWDWDWQPPDRYGSRFDYGLITTTQDTKDAVRLPTKAWFFYNVPHEPLISVLNGIDVIAWDHAPCFRRAIALGARSTNGKAVKFTRGFAAVAATLTFLRPKRVVVIGMGILCNGVTGSRYYDSAALPYYVNHYPNMAKVNPQWAANELTAGLVREGPHDFSTEAVLIRELAAETGALLIWEPEA